MSTDPNWLLSTTAQSASALVAIVGGFLVSRVVSLGSDRQSLTRRLDELQQRYHLKREELQVVYEGRHAYSVETFKRYTVDAFVQVHGQLSPEDALKEFWPLGAQEEEMLAVAKEFGITVRRVLDASKAQPSKADARGTDYTNSGDEEEDLILAALSRLHEGERQQSVRDRLGLAPLDVGPITRAIGDDKQLQRQERRIEREAVLNAEISALQAEADIVKEELQRLANPPGIRIGLAVLAYFAVVGILVPLAYMASRPGENDLWFRRLIVVLFGSGLGSLLVYIGWSVRQLRYGAQTNA